MKRFLISIFAIVALGGCVPQRQGRVVEPTETCDDYNVQFLFEVDGVKVYRFRDNGRSIYFSNTSGACRYTEVSSRVVSNGKTTTTQTTTQNVETICNSEE